MATVLVEEVTPQIVCVRLNRPEVLNALNVDMVRELHAALDDIEGRADCRVVILTGVGRGFCAGLDLSGYGDDDQVATRGYLLATYSRQRDIASLQLRLNSLRQPVIAAVNGAAAGGGLALVCAADIRIGSTTSLFAVSFIKAGYSACDMGVSWMLPRLVGVGRAHELMLTGRRFGAADALAYGLLIDVVEPPLLEAAAIAKAEEILLNAPVSVELTKSGMWAGVASMSYSSTIEFENGQQMISAMTEDQSEAARAFLEKRAPQYSWR